VWTLLENLWWNWRGMSKALLTFLWSVKCCKVESKGARHCCLGRDTNDKAHSTIHCHKTSHILPVTFHTFSSSHCSFRISREFLLSLCASMGYLKIFCLCFGSTRRLCTEISIYIYIYIYACRSPTRRPDVCCSVHVCNLVILHCYVQIQKTRQYVKCNSRLVR